MGYIAKRTISTTALLLIMSAGNALASSFVTLPAHGSKPAPSFVALGSTTTMASTPSPSIVALGTPSPRAAPPAVMVASAPSAPEARGTEDEPTAGPDKSIETAALPIPDELVAIHTVEEPFVTPGWVEDQIALFAPPPPRAKPRAPRMSPMVIRGGLKGEAFSRSAPRRATREVSAEQPNRSNLPESAPPPPSAPPPRRIGGQK